MNDKFTLFELNNVVKGLINDKLPGRYWVVGELSEVREAHNGHCYIELVQQGNSPGEIVAKARGAIWSRVYQILKPYFFEQTKQSLSVGMRVLLQVSVEFHELYGYSLVVNDIDPSYTLGDLARRREQIIKQLQEEGVLNLNKELPFPLLPQRIAVISSSTAAGYGDFLHQLHNNRYGFVFYAHLFPSPMQGSQVEDGVISALNRIALSYEEWDVVVIIRGGGATSDFSGFDTYNLANNCAQFPLPIITGIGHQRDETLLDAVSHISVKTPTAAANLLIETVAIEASRLNSTVTLLSQQPRSSLMQASHHLQSIQQQFSTQPKRAITDSRHKLNNLIQQFSVQTKLSLQQKIHCIELWNEKLKAVAPENILAMGYSITLRNGKSVRNSTELSKGDKIITRLSKGEIESIVK